MTVNPYADGTSFAIFDAPPPVVSDAPAGPSAAATDERFKNPLRPKRLADVIGQANAKRLMNRAIDACFERHQPLDHTLLIGPSGTGKSTFSHVVASELGVNVYSIEAPVSFDTLAELRTTMLNGDILQIEEIHQQAIAERRGRQAATRPEVLYALMEDRVLPTQNGLLPYPEITVIGTTTDEGMLPDAFVNRFPLRPRLERYSPTEVAQIATFNADQLGVTITPGAATMVAKASRGVPREVNNLMRNAALFAREIDTDVVWHVLDLNGLTPDGLTPSMQAMLTFLYTRAARKSQEGTIYQASVSTIATATGHSRDAKAIALRVEPFLIERGFVQVTHGGRRLTDAGVQRARELLACA